MSVNLLLAVVIGYLIGGIPTGIWIGRAVKGVDPRTVGSGSSGATNVSRLLGKQWAVVVLLLDALKGFLPVLFVASLLSDGTDATNIRVATAIGAVIGHVFTPYANFRGGKGIATAAGAMLALDPKAVAIALVVWLLVFVPFRRVSVASLCAALSLPIAIMVLGNRPTSIQVASIILCLFLVFTHRQNIQRLIAGREKPIV